MSTNGILVIDKPSGITSRDVVNEVALRFPRKTKIGHAGTLDPLATGVLVLAVGHATRFIESVQAMPKSYRTSIILGATSETDDADGTVTIHRDAVPVSESALRDALGRFVGEIEQTPPAYSAVRVEGQRAHLRARRGESIELAPRRIRIERIDLLGYAWPQLELEVHCGKGTYIRSIARDLGAALGVGGYVAVLRRLRIGPFTVESATPLDGGGAIELLPTRLAIGDIPVMAATQDEVQRLRFGQSIPATGHGPIAVFDVSEALIAVGRIENGVLIPEKVIPAGK